MSILEEVRAAQHIQDIILGHPMYLAVAVHYIKPKQIAYIRDTLKAVILEVIAMDDLDLETDPVAVSGFSGQAMVLGILTSFVSRFTSL